MLTYISIPVGPPHSALVLCEGNCNMCSTVRVYSSYKSSDNLVNAWGILGLRSHSNSLVDCSVPVPVPL